MRGIYEVSNPNKYFGKKAPRYRSGWELAVFRIRPQKTTLPGWGSETHRIPYKNPLTGKQTVYVPDILLVYKDAKGGNHAEMVEIKPAKQTLGEAKSQIDKAQAVINHAKWTAARAWCKSQGMGFRVITEHQIFNKPKNTKKRKK
jgi:hypothetical protein